MQRTQCPLARCQAQCGQLQEKGNHFLSTLPAVSQKRVRATHPVDVPGSLCLGASGAASPCSAFPKPAKPLDELEALGLVVGQAGLEEHRVHPELSVQ